MRVVLIIIMVFMAVSCGKRGDLLPPPGYDAPSEK